MAPEDRKDRTEMSDAVMPVAAPIAVAAQRRCLVRVSVSMVAQCEPV